MCEHKWTDETYEGVLSRHCHRCGEYEIELELQAWEKFAIDTGMADGDQGRYVIASPEQVLRAWKEMERERFALYEKIERISKVLAENGCDCECEHHWEDHGDECDLCLACRVADAMRG